MKQVFVIVDCLISGLEFCVIVIGVIYVGGKLINQMGFVGIFKFFVCMNLGNNEYLI